MTAFSQTESFREQTQSIQQHGLLENTQPHLSSHDMRRKLRCTVWLIWQEWFTFKVCVCVCVCVCVHAQSLSRIRLFATPRTVARPALLSMEFSRQEYWSGLPFPSPGELPDAGIKPVSPVSPALASAFFTIALPGIQTHTVIQNPPSNIPERTASWDCQFTSRLKEWV